MTYYAKKKMTEWYKRLLFIQRWNRADIYERLGMIGQIKSTHLNKIGVLYECPRADSEDDETYRNRLLSAIIPERKE